MAKGLKMLYSLLGLVLLTVLGNTILLHQRVLHLPALSWLPVDVSFQGFWKDFLAHYFLWAAVVLFVIVCLAILVVIFYPRRYSEVELADNHGKLKLKKSAVEAYVKTLVQAEGLMTNPKVRVQLYKKKFKVDVKGEITKRSNVLAHAEQLRQNLQTGLKAFFGLEQDISFSVKVKDVVNDKAPRSRRVE